ncbi:MAG: hypothetical protein HY760_03495, partial [Nitrospirae bacterium]|nr:hypothetical protein [Nitrospirota bacterium]
MRVSRAARRGWILFALLPLLAACAPTLSYHLQVDQSIALQRYDEADALIERERSQYGDRNAVLYHMDRAVTLHLAGRYAESNTHLDAAERRIDELYTKSITAETGAMFTNDNLLPYEGEDFEKVMVNLLSALNYTLLGEWDDALVEARKVDHKLNLLNDRYEKKNVYKEDAFARYLSGILYEAKGEVNDAFIAYRKAEESYRDYGEDYGTSLPPWLASDLLRTADALHLTEEFQSYRERYPAALFVPYPEFSKNGELVLIALDGRSPVKEDFFIDAPIPQGKKGTYLLRVALPRFVPIPSRIDRVELRVRGEGPETRVVAEPVENVTDIARKNLEDRIGRITAKAVARATAKYIAAQEVTAKARKEGGAETGALADFLTNVYAVATEQSDKRSWRTLPGEIRLARLPLPPGRYQVEAVYLDASGRILETNSFPEVEVKVGEK